MQRELLILMVEVLQILVVHLPALVWIGYRSIARSGTWLELGMIYAILLAISSIVGDGFYSPNRHPTTLAWYFSFQVCSTFFLAQPIWELTVSPLLRGRRRRRVRPAYVRRGKTVTAGPLWWPAWLIALVGVGLPVVVTTIFLSAV